MIEICRLIKIDFDTMENRNPYVENCIATFVDTEGLTAYGKCVEYIKNLPSQKQYTGWNGKVYPQFEIRKEYAE